MIYLTKCDYSHKAQAFMSLLSLQMAIIETPSDVDDAWKMLRVQRVGLPLELRLPQRDALYWLSKDKSVIICVGTGAVDQGIS